MPEELIPQGGIPQQAPQQPPQQGQQQAPQQAPGGQLPQEMVPKPVVGSQVDEKMGDQLSINLKDQIFDHASDTIQAQLEQAEDLPQAIGQMAAEILRSQLDSMSAADKMLPQEQLLSAGETIVTHLMEMAEAMGLIEGEDEAAVTEAKSEALNAATQYFARDSGQYIDQAGLEEYVKLAASGEFD